jgi:hypothetical protein
LIKATAGEATAAAIGEAPSAAAEVAPPGFEPSARYGSGRDLIAPPGHEWGASPPIPAPLPESTRRFLRPRVGIDPATVRVHRGGWTQQATSALRADALTVEDDVVLGEADATDSPEGLGLLAHELTHVVRARQPRFVPPVARSPAQRGAVPAFTADDGRGAPELAGEEALARRVETQVRREARAEQARALQPEPAAFAPPRAESVHAPAAGAPPRVAPEAHPEAAWGGLPAPWEPLPTWITESTPEPTRVSESPEPVEMAAPNVAAGEGSEAEARATSGAEASGASVVPAAVKAAAVDRPVEEAPAAGHAAPAAHGAPVQPDIDALARQVYSILKRRLEVERRRSI